MYTPIRCARCGTDKVELFKVEDDVWAQAGFPPNVIVCLKCFEGGLGRPLTVSDIDLTFPWWGQNRLEYYQGIMAGLGVKYSSAFFTHHPEYRMGLDVGQRIAKNPPAGKP